MIGFASLITLGLIFGFVFVVVLLAAYFSGSVDITYVIGLTVLFNFLGWLVSPFFMDLMFRWFYSTKKMELGELEEKSKRVADFIVRVCKKYSIKVPSLRHIVDDNPTAFCFGSGVFNARLCFSEGLFTYLNDEEVEAVIAHELGHIQRRDFIIMTIASTGVQILYEISQYLARKSSRSSGDNKGKNPAAIVGLVSYVLYFIGIYLLLFLSRTREYGADEFSAKETQNPDALTRALIKIAYGIIAKPDDATANRLLNSTRALGPYDNQAARHLGTAYQGTQNNWPAISKVIAYDLINPWAKILQLQSTHPLTGRRIEKLNGFAKQLGKKVSIETDTVRNMSVDNNRLYKGFFVGVLIHFLPLLLPFLVLIYAGISRNILFSVWLPASLGLAMLIKMFYKYPQTQPQNATTLDMLSDLYASPVRGNLYALNGTVIGRGVAGAVFSEDMMLQDSTGLVYLNYESAFSFLGNFIFAISKVRKLIGKKVTATGWFFRDIGHHLDLNTMDGEGMKIKSHPRLWGVIFGIVFIVISLLAASQLNVFSLNPQSQKINFIDGI